MGETMRRELDAIEAASKPLPLPDSEEMMGSVRAGKRPEQQQQQQQPVHVRREEEGVDSPLGPL
jgi:hypothetical protein